MATSAELTALLDASYKAHQDAKPRRTYLGASMVGLECERQAAYQYFDTRKDEGRGFSGQLYRIFDMGHDGEDRMAQYLRIAGFDLHTHRPDGSQFGFSVCNGKFAGHIDGVIVAGPTLTGMLDPPFPLLWENKALNDKGWNECVRMRVERAKRLYYAQVQVYEAYMGLASCLFTALNRDSGEVYAEVIGFDAPHAQTMSDRAVRILEARQADDLPRIATASTDYRCKLCDFAATCWATRPTVIGSSTQGQQQAPTWLDKRGR